LPFDDGRVAESGADVNGKKFFRSDEWIIYPKHGEIIFFCGFAFSLTSATASAPFFVMPKGKYNLGG